MREDKIVAFCRAFHPTEEMGEVGEVIEYNNDYYRVTDISEFYIHVECIDLFREAVRSAVELSMGRS